MPPPISRKSLVEGSSSCRVLRLDLSEESDESEEEEESPHSTSNKFEKSPFFLSSAGGEDNLSSAGGEDIPPHLARASGETLFQLQEQDSIRPLGSSSSRDGNDSGLDLPSTPRSRGVQGADSGRSSRRRGRVEIGARVVSTDDNKNGEDKNPRNVVYEYDAVFPSDCEKDDQHDSPRPPKPKRDAHDVLFPISLRDSIDVLTATGGPRGGTSAGESSSDSDVVEGGGLVGSSSSLSPRRLGLEVHDIANHEKDCAAGARPADEKSGQGLSSSLISPEGRNVSATFSPPSRGRGGSPRQESVGPFGFSSSSTINSSCGLVVRAPVHRITRYEYGFQNSHRRRGFESHHGHF